MRQAINDGLTNGQRYFLRHGKIKRLGKTIAQGRLPNGKSLEYLREHLFAKTTDCVVWPFRCAPNGYGQIYFEGNTFGVHRVAWILAFGTIPEGKDVLHHCDNRPCFNLLHLFLGDDLSNKADQKAKGRQPARERHLQAKLTESQVAEIRVATGFHYVIAERYGVERSTVTAIKNGRIWK